MWDLLRLLFTAMLGVIAFGYLTHASTLYNCSYMRYLTPIVPLFHVHAMINMDWVQSEYRIILTLLFATFFSYLKVNVGEIELFCLWLAYVAVWIINAEVERVPQIRLCNTLQAFNVKLFGVFYTYGALMHVVNTVYTILLIQMGSYYSQSTFVSTLRTLLLLEHSNKLLKNHNGYHIILFLFLQKASLFVPMSTMILTINLVWLTCVISQTVEKGTGTNISNCINILHMLPSVLGQGKASKSPKASLDETDKSIADVPSNPSTSSIPSNPFVDILTKHLDGMLKGDKFKLDFNKNWCGPILPSIPDGDNKFKRVNPATATATADEDEDEDVDEDKYEYEDENEGGYANDYLDGDGDKSEHVICEFNKDNASVNGNPSFLTEDADVDEGEN